MKEKKLVFENTTSRKKRIEVKPINKGERSFIALFNEKSVKGTKDGFDFTIVNKYDSGMQVTYPVTLTPYTTTMATPVELALGTFTTIHAIVPAKSKITLICTPKKQLPKPVLVVSPTVHAKP